ncbi:Ribosomal RNA small subunit methyltransferase G [Novipirellula aureliae]|uniref:Ribosomal RNA small subunit methyltransferase G n=1 Tax=Novipirellula aureliae TaxID=2527966 RepID=A0A5C6DXZ9_9BACT|nr:RsmG family class I SAM-dependent methyltransferase [Novipirellula aureliae]TWU41502.1 Ribosomal RNA small subunit methyltransferase G [Novipirellula aureliae]
MSLDPDFASALVSHSMEIDETIALKLQQYVEVMWRMNEQLNLTRHTTWDLFVGRDLRDCLQLAPLLEPGEEVLDLGSGNGIPGIPLSILRSDIEVSLAESVTKRANALGEIVEQLEIPVPVYGARGEDLLEDFRFTTVVSRAVGSIAKFCRWVEPHWGSVDRLLLIKGPRWVQERGEARHLGALANLQIRRVAIYPLGIDDVKSELDDSSGREPSLQSEPNSDTAPGEGVILQIWPSGKRGAKYN